MPGQQERTKSPGDALGLLGVDQTHGPQLRVPGQGVPGDQAAAVVSDDGEVGEAELIDDGPYRAQVLIEAHLGRGPQLTVAGSREINDMAGRDRRQVGK